MITILKIGNGYVSPNRKEYLIDSENDVQDLPTNTQGGYGTPGLCDPGSIAYTPDLSKVYMMGNDGQWYDCTAYSGNNDNGGEDDGGAQI